MLKEKLLDSKKKAIETNANVVNDEVCDKFVNVFFSKFVTSFFFSDWRNTQLTSVLVVVLDFSKNLRSTSKNVNTNKLCQNKK